MLTPSPKPASANPTQQSTPTPSKNSIPTPSLTPPPHEAKLRTGVPASKPPTSCSLTTSART